MSLTFDRLLNFWEAVTFDPLTATALVATAASTAIGAAGQFSAGQNAAAMGRYQQAEAVQQAETSTATGQRAMLEERRKGELVESTLQARAGASGGTSTDTSVLKLGSDIRGRSEYNALMDLSQGQNQAAGLYNMGQGYRYGGQVAQMGDNLSGIGTIASGVGSMARTYAYGSGSSGYGGNFSGPGVGMPPGGIFNY